MDDVDVRLCEKPMDERMKLYFNLLNASLYVVQWWVFPKSSASDDHMPRGELGIVPIRLGIMKLRCGRGSLVFILGLQSE